jgi:hypothetical protein
LTGYEGDKNPKHIRTLIDILTRSAILQSVKEANELIPLLAVNIVPEVTKIGPENFLKGPELIKLGEQAARNPEIYKTLQQIGATQTQPKIRIKMDLNTPVRIDEIRISGTEKITLSTLTYLCNIEPGMEVNNTQLSEAVDKLYHILRFKLVHYNLMVENGKNILIFNFIDKDDKQLELGLNLSSIEGPGLMVRTKFFDLLLPSSLLKLNIGISAFPKIQLNYEYLPFKGKRGGLYVDLFLNRSKMPNVVRDANNSNYTLGYFFSNNFNVKIGSRIRLWYKWKAEWPVDVVLTGNFTYGNAGRTGKMIGLAGNLEIGVYHEGILKPIGWISAIMDSEAKLPALTKRAEAGELEGLVVGILCNGLQDKDGWYSLRHPRFYKKVGWRADKNPNDCTLEAMMAELGRLVPAVRVPCGVPEQGRRLHVDCLRCED